jgi:hypothetical protein
MGGQVAGDRPMRPTACRAAMGAALIQVRRARLIWVSACCHGGS